VAAAYNAGRQRSPPPPRSTKPSIEAATARLLSPFRTAATTRSRRSLDNGAVM
jgi:hypothetical protein